MATWRRLTWGFRASRWLSRWQLPWGASARPEWAAPAVAVARERGAAVGAGAGPQEWAGAGAGPQEWAGAGPREWAVWGRVRPVAAAELAPAAAGPGGRLVLEPLEPAAAGAPVQSVSADIADQFHTDMLNNDLTPTDPLAALRRSVGREYNDTGIRSSIDYTLANLVKAHNLRSAGDTVSKWVSAPNNDVVFPAGYRLNGELVKGATR